MPEAAATKTCTIVTAVTVLTSRRPTSRSGGTYRSSGIMTMAPPTPTRPDTNAPARLSATRVRRKVTPSRLPQAGIVGGHVAERLVGDRLENGLHLRQRLVAGAALVSLEQKELVLEVASGLARDGRPELGRVARGAPLSFGP